MVQSITELFNVILFIISMIYLFYNNGKSPYIMCYIAISTWFIIWIYKIATCLVREDSFEAEWCRFYDYPYPECVPKTIFCCFTQNDSNGNCCYTHIYLWCIILPISMIVLGVLGFTIFFSSYIRGISIAFFVLSGVMFCCGGLVSFYLFIATCESDD